MKSGHALDYLQSQPTPGELHGAPLVMRQEKISEKKKNGLSTPGRVCYVCALLRVVVEDVAPRRGRAPALVGTGTRGACPRGGGSWCSWGRPAVVVVAPWRELS